MSHADLAIQVTDLAFAYDERYLYERLSFSVLRGGHLLIRGRSGAGKSSLLRLIAGLERLDQGEIHIAGELVSSTTRHVPPERRSVGMVFQDFALFPHLSVKDNVAFGLFRALPNDRRARVNELLARLDVTELASRFPSELSGGQQQRVALARALAPDPRVLLLDEPFSSLDPTLRQAVRASTFRTTNDLGTTVICVSHDDGDAAAVFDQTLVLP